MSGYEKYKNKNTTSQKPTNSLQSTANSSQKIETSVNNSSLQPNTQIKEISQSQTPKIQNGSIQNKKLEDQMRLENIKSEEEVKNSFSKMLKEQEFISLINEYNKKYANIVDSSNKAIIILGQEKEDLNLMSSLLKNIYLNVIDITGRGDWAFQESSPRTNTSVLDNFDIKGGKCLTYKSNYLNIKNSPHESTIDKFFLQQISSTIPTKFILTTKHIETKDYGSPNTQNKIKNLGNTIKQFINLLSNIDIENYNLSLVFINTPKSKTIENIGAVINDAVSVGRFTEQQQQVVQKLSVYLLPPASERPKPEDYQELLNITNNNNYITPNENNKLIVNGVSTDYILNSVNAINNELKLSISELKTSIEKKWEEEKSTLFNQREENSSYQNILIAPNKLKQLIDTINNCQNINNSDKTLGDFLEVVKELNQVLGIPKSETTLENLLNYLKYLGNIEFSEKENSISINPSEWFSSLFGGFEKNNIKTEILESFKNMLHNDEYSFYNQINGAVEECYQHIKDGNILDSETVNNIYKLKGFLERIKNSQGNIKDLEDVGRVLSHSISSLPDIYSPLSNIINDNINKLQKLVGSVEKQDVQSLWKYIITSKTIENISIILNEIIYDKLLHTEIPKNQTIDIYNSLEKLLIESHKSVTDKDEFIYMYQLGNIYCKKAQCPIPDKAIKLSKESLESYEQAVKHGSIVANLKLGMVELSQRNFAKSLEYLKNTPSNSWTKETFNNLIKEKKESISSKLTEDNIENVTKLSSELADLCINQAKFLGGRHMNLQAENLLETARATYFDLITKLINTEENKNLAVIASIYYKLAKISPPNATYEYIEEAKKYDKLAKNFYGKSQEAGYTDITNINSFEEFNMGMSFLTPYKTSGEVSLVTSWSNLDFLNE